MNTATQTEYQLEAEYKRREILLSSLKNENAFLILKLSEVLDRKEDKEFISKAEYFQTEFIKKDEYIKELENDIKSHLHFISSLQEENIPAKVSEKFKKLGNEIINFEKNFLHLKNEFDQYLLHD